MARVTHDGLQGSIGKYTFYTVNGVNYLRAKPGKRVKKRGQPQNPVVSIFSTVSGYGSAMARHISRNFLFPFGRDTYNSLRGWMWKQYAPNHKESVWGLATAFDFCQLNPQAGLGDFLKATITVSDRGKQGILLSLPAIDPARQMKLPPKDNRSEYEMYCHQQQFQ